MRAIGAEIKDHDRRYYEEDAPSVSDAEYDALRQRYEALEDQFPELKSPESLTEKVGSKVSEKFGKIRHKVPMLSLGNAFADEEVEEFVERIRRFLNGRPRSRSPSPPSPRSTACRSACATRTESSSPPPPAATARSART